MNDKNARHRMTILSTIAKTNKSSISLAMVDDYDFSVVVKAVDNGNIEVYKQVQKIKSVHIPTIYDCYEEDEKIVIIEEFIEGITLEEYCRQKEFSNEDLRNIFLQICNAVKQLHSCNPPIIHRDIKPKNMLITKEQLVKLIDYDASRVYKIEEQEDTRKLGTVEYAPPEQFGYSQTDIRSDIYSVGVVFYELIYGKKYSKISMEHNFKDMEVSKDKILFQAIIDKCTMFDPKNRYQDIDTLIQDLNSTNKKKKYI